MVAETTAQRDQTPQGAAQERGDHQRDVVRQGRGVLPLEVTQQGPDRMNARALGDLRPGGTLGTGGQVHGGGQEQARGRVVAGGWTRVRPGAGPGSR